VAVIISASGRLPELLEVADRAHERGAAVVAITASQSPLARKADTVLAVDHVEDSATQVPMISRILQLLVIDILTVGVAMRRAPDGAPALDLPLAAPGTAPVTPAPVRQSSADTAQPGATPTLSHMTLHSR
jgi:glucokinase